MNKIYSFLIFFCYGCERSFFLYQLSFRNLYISEHVLIVTNVKWFAAFDSQIFYIHFFGNHVWIFFHKRFARVRIVECSENFRSLIVVRRIAVVDEKTINRYFFRHVARVPEIMLTRITASYQDCV